MAQTMADIKDKIKSLDDIGKWLARREIKELPNILSDGEDLIDIADGIYNNGMGILVATNRRLIFIDKGLLWGLKVVDFGFNKIQSIEYSTSVLTGKITIYSAGNAVIISNVTKQLCKSFCDTARNAISLYTNNVASNGNDSDPSYLKEIEHLAQLRDKGIITPDEYEAKKQQLLRL